MNYNRFSNYFGLVAHYEFARPIQSLINRFYVSKFEIDLSEFEVPEGGFASLNALFTRRLKTPRELGEGFVSPSDGLVLACGKGSNNTALSVKNYEYDARELLGRALGGEELKGEFDYLNIYLSPSDYHHYHAPSNLSVESAAYVKGELFSVAPSWLARVPNLYPRNERVILRTCLENGKLLWIVFVGAWNVGKIKIDFEPRIDTNAAKGDALYEYSNLKLKKGEHLGNFELGSTIVLISEPGALNYRADLNGAKIKFGENLGEIQI